MDSLLTNFFSVARFAFENIRSLLSSSSVSKFNLKSISSVPKVLHCTIDDNFLNKFDEVVIIGDLHGCFDEFAILLDKIHDRNSTKVDPRRILKICAGDLVNKGPKNREVIEYMRNNSDNCISVRGNHDEVIIREYNKYLDNREIIEANAWIKDLSTEQILYLSQLPYTISIPKLNIIVVHAGLVPDVSLEQQTGLNMTKMRNLIASEENDIISYQASDKDNSGNPWASFWTGPSHVYFGHDAKRKLQEYSFATGLDTGVVYGGKLTGKFVKGPRSGTYIYVNALKAWKDPLNKG